MTDLKLLQSAVENFAILSNVSVSVYDGNRNFIASGKDNISFCKKVRKNVFLSKECTNCDKNGFALCENEKKPCKYRCHMGLTEITAPITFNGVLIGYIIIGQFADFENKKNIIENVTVASQKYSFNPEKLLECVSSIPTADAKFINALCQLAEMCVSYITLNNILHLESNGLATEIRLYIVNNLDKELSVEIICKKYGLSATALYKTFKSAYGCSLSEIIQWERMKKAKELLSITSLSVSEVASAIGIPDANYFSRKFKVSTGLTPKEYRKNLGSP